ncbi:MAG: nucleotidyltransferase domain-containing protein, partial [Candidatus Methanomethylicia archaeon]
MNVTGWLMGARWLMEICRRLLEYDSNIVEIVQFGSSVYASEYARDVDILVLTRRARDYDGYLDAVCIGDSSFNVDVVVMDISGGLRLREEFMRSVLGAFRVLYGRGKYILEYARTLSDPTFEELG